MDITATHRYTVWAMTDSYRRLLVCLLLTFATACSETNAPEDSGAMIIDSGAGDVGSARDAASSDAASSDAEGSDTSAPDTGVEDAAIVDTGEPFDGGEAIDAGQVDAGVRSVIFPGFCPSTDTAPGLYRGTLASNLNDITDASCVGSTPGRDGALRVTVPVGATLTVTYASTGDGILYILDSCPVTSSCLVGADSSISGPETVSWTNNGGSDNPVYVVLDNQDINDSGAFTLDLFLQ